MSAEKVLERGREAYRKQAWRDACKLLSQADKKSPLDPEDLEILAMSAYLTGNFQLCNEILSRAHNVYLQQGNVEGAARSAFWLGFILLNRGEYARGGGWISQARNVLLEDNPECVEMGYLLLPAALKCLSEGDTEGSLKNFEKVGEVADRFQDRDLKTLSRLGKGQTLVRMGRYQSGVILLDEAMAIVDTGTLSPVVTGIVYCAVIETCLEVFDLGRAQEWTDALSDWCTSHPHLVPFRGQCLTRRSEIMQLHGKWQDAIKEANHAVGVFSQSNLEPASGAAFYQLGEIQRLCGDYVEAENAYNEANKFGRKPQPGLALLRLAQGQTKVAQASIEQVMNEAKNLKTRSRSLPAYIEIMIAANETEKAGNGIRELTEIAGKLNAPFINASVAYAKGTLSLSLGNPHQALEYLLTAYSIWEELEAPYETARTRVLIGKASREIGDLDASIMELEAALWTFNELNAKPDIEITDKLLRNRNMPKSGGLSNRELEVLQLIAGGKTNKYIASKLYISERTVERHVSNIFNKLNVSSRSAATAYAFKNQLL